ncbi:MAG: hypothetical protein ACLUD2_00705 [Clostridium sp.]
MNCRESWIDDDREILEKLVRSADERTSGFKEGIRTVILGKPNAGKSSLLNYAFWAKRACHCYGYCRNDRETSLEETVSGMRGILV